MGRGGPWWRVGLVGGAGAPIACCLRRHRCRGAAPRRARLMRCTVRRMRPSWDFALRRRCAGGVLQRGGPKGQAESLGGCLCRLCRVVGVFLGVSLLVYVFRVFPWRFPSCVLVCHALSTSRRFWPDFYPCSALGLLAYLKLKTWACNARIVVLQRQHLCASLLLQTAESLLC